MAVVTFSQKDLNSLVGTTLTKKQLEDVIPMIGCEFEGENGDELQFDITADRPDMLSVEGFARAVKPFLGKKNKELEMTFGKAKLTVDSSVKSVRPIIGCAIIRNVKMSDNLLKSIIQTQEKLHVTLGRKRSKVAIGVHDMKNLTPPFTYKAIDPKSLSFVPLDFNSEMTLEDILKNHPKGKSYAHILEDQRKHPIIVDSKDNVLSFPPIINGELTRVTKDSKDIFIDVTGTDEKAAVAALNILCTAFYERGSVIEIVKVNRIEHPPLVYSPEPVDLEYAQKLLGTKLDKNTVKKALARMDIEYKNGSAYIPPYRNDILHPMDIVEDIGIGIGYENFEAELPDIHTEANRSEHIESTLMLKEIMIGLGYQEVITSILTTNTSEFKWMEAKPVKVAETSNSVADDCGICRRNLIPSLMNVLSQNKHRDYPQKIFEVGDTISLEKSEIGAVTKRKLAGLLIGNDVGYENLASDVDSLMNNLGLEYKFRETSHPSFIDGRVAKISVGNKTVGVVGEIHPKVLNNWGLEFPVTAIEIDFNSLIG